MVFYDDMKLVLQNTGSKTCKLSKRSIVAFATTVLEVDGADENETWDVSQLRKQVDLENLLDERKEAVLNMFEEVSSVFRQNEYDVQAADVRH